MTQRLAQRWKRPRPWDTTTPPTTWVAVGSGSQKGGGSQNKTDLSWWSSKTPSQTEDLWKLMLVTKESLDKAEFFSIQEGRLRNPFPLAKGLTAGKFEAFTSDRCNRTPLRSLRKPLIFLVRLRSKKWESMEFYDCPAMVLGVEWSYMELQGGILRPWTRKTWRTYKTPHIMWREAQCRTQLCFFFTSAASSSAAD